MDPEKDMGLTMEDDDMIMIIVGDVGANEQSQDAKRNTSFPIPIKEEQVDEVEEYNWDPDSILETAELHGQYVTFIKKEEQSIEDEYYEYDYLDDSKKEYESSSEEDENLEINNEPYQSYIDQLRRNFPKMRKDDEYLIAHLTELMKQTKPPMPPIDFCQSVDNMLVCAYCNVESPTLPVACRHYQKKHGTRYLTCFACGSTFKCTTGLYKHEKRCTASGAALVLRARGRYLGRKGRTRPFLTKHKFEPWGDKKKQTKKRFYCSECTANFHNKEALRSHEYMHRGERPYQCDRCPMAYTSAIALRRHLQTHANTEFICDVCGRSFKLKTTLIVHMNTHLPQRKFPCDMCERRFAQKHALQHHVNRDHLNIPPPIACAACPKRFPRVSNLNAHMKAKHGLTVMTRKMFFKALPMMKDTEMKKASVVFNENDDSVLAIEPLSKPSPDRSPHGEPKDEVEIRVEKITENETVYEYMIGDKDGNIDRDRFPRVSNLNAHMKAKHGLTVMTRKMFFKALPMMKDTEMKKASVVFNENDDSVLAIEPLSKPSPDRSPHGEPKDEVEIRVEKITENETVHEYMIGDKDGNIDRDRYEVIVNTTEEDETVPKKAAVKTSLPNSCELEFASFITKKESPEVRTQTRIPRVDLSLARTKLNKAAKSSAKNPNLNINVARMHEKIKETCGRNMPELTEDKSTVDKTVERKKIEKDVVKNTNTIAMVTRRSKAMAEVNDSQNKYGDKVLRRRK